MGLREMAESYRARAPKIAEAMDAVADKNDEPPLADGVRAKIAAESGPRVTSTGAVPSAPVKPVKVPKK
jgi:hypothetical protein